MRNLAFTKMHGAGNDFVIIDNRQNRFSEEEIIALAPKLCRRRFGIGADGIMTLQTPNDSALDYTMFYRNADGSDAGMCGNGARCMALFASKLGLGTHLKFNVHETVYKAEVKPEKKFVTISFPMQVKIGKLTLNKNHPMYQVYAGTEHIVMESADAAFREDDKLRSKGRALRYDKRFNPPGTNVNFIQGVASNEIKIKTYERGVEDLTLACGTGAIASAVAWHHINPKKKEPPITVQAQGGTLSVNFAYNRDEDFYSKITLSGEAHFAYEGKYQF